jgi:hypothetical protein
MTASWMDTILNVAGKVDAALWGPWTLGLIAFVSVYLTIRTRFFQVGAWGSSSTPRSEVLFVGNRDRSPVPRPRPVV